MTPDHAGAESGMAPHAERQEVPATDADAVGVMSGVGLLQRGVTLSTTSLPAPLPVVTRSAPVSVWTTERNRP